MSAAHPNRTIRPKKFMHRRRIEHLPDFKFRLQEFLRLGVKTVDRQGSDAILRTNFKLKREIDSAGVLIDSCARLLKWSPNFIAKFILPSCILRGAHVKGPVCELINQRSSHLWRQPSVILKLEGVDHNCSRLWIGRSANHTPFGLTGLCANARGPRQGWN